MTAAYDPHHDWTLEDDTTHSSWTGVTSHPGADQATCPLCVNGLAYEAMVAEAS